MKQRTGSGSRNLFVVNDDDDYAFYSRKLEAEGIPFLLQEYVGSGSEEYTVGVVCRKDGSVIGSITVHRLLEGLSIQQSGTAKGKLVEISTGISQGVVEDNEKIQEQCQAYSVKLGVTGPANFQGRVVDGVFLVFELNPRFSGTTPFRAGVGFNDVDLVIRDRLWHNRPLRKPVFKTGVVVLRSLENVFVPLREMQKVAKMSISDS
jgi:carbamoyl-phosphate synthase large subunit